jgi:hypothetical protein
MALVALSWEKGWRVVAVVPAAQVVIFLYAFQLQTYSEFRRDAGAERMMKELIRHAGAEGRKIRAGGTPIAGMTVNYYRLRYKLAWLERCEMLGADGDYDYYVLHEADHPVAGKRGLEVLYVDAESKVMLARRGRSELN